MDSEMIIFFKEARKRNLCESFAQKWVKLREKDEFIDFCLLPGSIPYMAVSMYEKWGISKDYLLREFPNYINGRYISSQVDGIDANAEFFIAYDDSYINIKNHLYHVSHTKKSILCVNETICPIIHVSNNSDVVITGLGYNTIHIFLYDKSKIYIDNTDNNIKNIKITNFSDESIIDYDGDESRLKIAKGDIQINAYGMYNIKRYY